MFVWCDVSAFRVGDRVRILSTDYDEFEVFVGRLATVDYVYESMNDVSLYIDGQPDDVAYVFTEEQLACPCLHCQWQRTDRSEDFYRWAATREYQPPLRPVIGLTITGVNHE